MQTKKLNAAHALAAIVCAAALLLCASRYAAASMAQDRPMGAPEESAIAQGSAQEPPAKKKSPWTPEQIAVRNAHHADTTAGRSFLLGAYGELVRIENPMMIYGFPCEVILREDGGGEKLLLNDGVTPLAEVTPGGILALQITQERAQQTDFSLEAFPRKKFWKLEKGAMTQPPIGSIAFYDGKQDVLLRPNNKNQSATSVYFLGAGNTLYLLPATAARPPDVLEVVKKDGGFDLRHQGPHRSGLYLSVAADRRLTYGETFPNAAALNAKSGYWPYVEKDEKTPTAEFLGTGPISTRPEDKRLLHVFENGKFILLRTPPIP